MTTTFWLAVFPLAAVLAFVLFRSLQAVRSPRALRRPCYADPEAAHVAMGAAQRLFNPSDRGYLRSRKTVRVELDARLKAGRRKALFLYLWEVRQEYIAIVDDAQAAARYSLDESFGDEIIRSSFRFHRLYAALWLQGLVAAVLFRPVDLSRLVAIYDGLYAGRLDRQDRAEASISAAAGEIR